MKPCTYEQDLLFVIHGESSLLQRFRIAWHCLFCEDCKRRRQEFMATSRVLMSLRPAPVAVAAGFRPSKKGRLLLCSAVVAIAAAAASYYAAFGSPFGGKSSGCAPVVKAPAVRCEKEDAATSGGVKKPSVSLIHLGKNPSGSGKP